MLHNVHRGGDCYFYQNLRFMELWGPTYCYEKLLYCFDSEELLIHIRVN